MFQNHSNNKGFTLVEMAIVLIVIGIILGMVFKGRQLIDGAKVKSLQSNYTKIEAAVNTFYDRYGYYPGDGCGNVTNITSISSCKGTKDGRLTNLNEQNAFWILLIDITGILPKSERKAINGNEWSVVYTSASGKNYLQVTSMDTRYVCVLDKKIDDSDSDTGNIYISTRANVYDETTDCWSLNKVETARFYLLP